MKTTKYIFAALFCGALVGLVLPTESAYLGDIGKIIISLIKMAAVPLMFFVIINAIVTNDVNLRQARSMLAISTINVLLALSIGLGLSTFFKPGAHFSLSAANENSPAISSLQKIDFVATLQSYIPQSFVEPFVENSIISIVFLSLLLGFALRQLKRECEQESKSEIMSAICNALHLGQRLFEIILTWCVKLVPFAVFGVVAKMVGQYGFAPMKSLLTYTTVCILGFLLQIFVVYQSWLYFYVGLSLQTFWRIASEPFIYAFGANSSLATLPLTLKSLKKMGVSDSAAAMGACIGTNLNNDGIILYEGVAVLFIAQLYGIDLSFSQQLIAVFSCMIAAIGVAGVPEAGFVSLSLVVVTVGLPTESLPLLLSVDWLLARFRSGVNVLSDHIVSLAIDTPSPRVDGERVVAN